MESARARKRNGKRHRDEADDNDDGYGGQSGCGDPKVRSIAGTDASSVPALVPGAATADEPSPSDDADALALIGAHHAAWVTWLDRQPANVRHDLDFAMHPDGVVPLHDPARHTRRARVAFWREFGAPPSTYAATMAVERPPRKRQRTAGPGELIDGDDDGVVIEHDHRVVEMAVWSTPKPCAYGEDCRYRATCSFAHGDTSRMCECSDDACPFGHPRRSRPQRCMHGAWDVCLWNARAECRFHHGIAAACECTSVRCLKAHAARTKKHFGSVNKTCLACGLVGHVATDCLRERTANQRGCGLCGDLKHSKRVCPLFAGIPKGKGGKKARKKARQRAAKLKQQRLKARRSTAATSSERAIIALAAEAHPGQVVRVGREAEIEPDPKVAAGAGDAGSSVSSPLARFGARGTRRPRVAPHLEVRVGRQLLARARVASASASTQHARGPSARAGAGSGAWATAHDFRAAQEEAIAAAATRLELSKPAPTVPALPRGCVPFRFDRMGDSDGGTGPPHLHSNAPHSQPSVKTRYTGEELQQLVSERRGAALGRARTGTSRTVLQRGGGKAWTKHQPLSLPKYYESDEEPNRGYGYGYGSDDGYASDDGICGFTRAQCDELLSQGVKPWEDDAGAVMSALDGGGYYF